MEGSTLYSVKLGTGVLLQRDIGDRECTSVSQILKHQQERPYHSDSTASRLLSEVKHCRARLVLRWGTTLESLVLFFCSCYIHCISNLLPLIYYATILTIHSCCYIMYNTAFVLTSFLSFAQLLLLAFFQIFGGYILAVADLHLAAAAGSLRLFGYNMF